MVREGRERDVCPAAGPKRVFIQAGANSPRQHFHFGVDPRNPAWLLATDVAQTWPMKPHHCHPYRRARSFRKFDACRNAEISTNLGKDARGPTLSYRLCI